MDPLRKYEYEHEENEGGVSYSFGDVHGAAAYSKPEASSRAYSYEDDITQDALAQLQADADVFLADGDWVLIDGYGG
ncbi:hypothetical protein [Methylorubrum podarium]|uniref:hypothetical protein n=1 Tax=Methylorubrum podarium TaxID=200476 RepID=UPI001EE1E3D4|nr:hypothetical protein [Methylorubrum podarium]GJE72153.1 hypothetical protein CHKEEEPN_3707 [Methylorubrum podarium]